jgi:predicted amidohydrolase
MTTEAMTGDEGGGERLRLGLVQWDMRRVDGFGEWLGRVRHFVSVAAADYGVRVVLFPEYFTVPLLSAEPPRPAQEAIRRLAGRTAEVNAALAELARGLGVWLVAGSQPVAEPGGLRNACFVFGPGGEDWRQDKRRITPWEREAWGIRGGGAAPELLGIAGCKAGVQICYDVEFPGPCCALGEAGMEVLLVPYCTDDRRGHLRVTRCAMARAVENQAVVAAAGCVGNLEGVETANIHYAESGVYTPVDLAFPRDGIAALATPGIEDLLVAEIDMAALRRSRAEGTVTPLRDRLRGEGQV